LKKLPPFDELKKMAESSPESLEILRKELVEDVIKNAPIKNQERLRGLQFKIDTKIKTSRSPIEAVSRVYDEMMNSFDKLNEELNKFESATKDIKSLTKDLTSTEEDSEVKLKVWKKN
jgi:predicted  nucleic acid-binding Zn-ribbon protein